MPSRNLDPIKKMIAQAVQHHLIPDPGTRPPLPTQPLSVKEIDATAQDALTTVIRVRTTDSGTRYFQVRVSEMK